MRMRSINTKKTLATVLSRLKGFEKPKVWLEQYETESETASELLWNAYMQRDIEDKVIIDLGAGTGILGIGAAILGANKVFMVEKDHDAIKVMEENIEFVEEAMGIEIKDNVRIIHMDIEEFNPEKMADTVIMNPPFGTKEEHADRVFLEKAKNIAKKIYTFHKSSTREFIYAYCKDNQLNVEEEVRINYLLKKSMKFHKKKIERIDVSLYRIRV